MFPSKFFSTGGDEINTNCFANDPETQEILSSTGQTLDQALSKFTETTHGALEKIGKTPVVWEGARTAWAEMQLGPDKEQFHRNGPRT